MASFGKLSYAQKQCVAGVGKLMQQSSMIFEGARVGVAVSGGVDSFTLLHVMRIRQAIVPFPFEIMALHVNPGFDPGEHAPLAAYLAEHGVPGHLEVTDYGPRAHSEENRANSPCFYCAMLRRKRLFDLCRAHNLTHLAFGHTVDDLAATFFMNILQNGRVEGMSHKEPFFHGRLMVIRPSLGVEKKYIKAAARQWGLPTWTNTCPSNGISKRDEISRWLTDTWRQDARIKNNVFNALRRHQLDLK